ncbi:DJ-1 family glyoxalase III [Marinicellulosiphila megalodicopiae]|uniref:DJ-1 family glyoxalase III n=1 Tax=Marinicellulosiphila megalodicopiae TaxID=2724896 RepID=UPI003BB04566
MSTNMTVLIPLAPGFEELEMVSIQDLCVRAGFEVVLAATNKKNVQGARGLNVVAHTHIDDVIDQDFDAIILPGGLPGADHLRDNHSLKTLLLKQHNAEKLIGAICAAPKVLIQHGIIESQSFTAFPNSQNEFTHLGSQQLNLPIVQNGHVITSRGPGTAMDFALYVIEKLTTLSHRLDVETKLVR